MRLKQALSQPVDIASLAALRIMLSGLLLVGLLRVWSKGLVHSSYVAPQFFFPHYAFSWLPAPGRSAYWLFAILVVLAITMAFGLYFRLSAALFCLLFSYLHFLDATNYLNHYYLVSLLTGLLACSPAGNLWSLDARLSRQPLPTHMPAWVLWLFQFQIGLVYFFAGLAKLKADWLFQGQPLRTWLAANSELPVLGPLFAQAWVAVGMSWVGALYDLTIPLWLSLRRTRPYAYIAVVAFHLLTARLFEIGMFPFLMITSSLLFLPPSWPRVFFRLPLPEPCLVAAPSPQVLALVGLYAALQVLVPLRHFLYPGNMLWTEQGYRFAWHVMVIEKTGSTEFTVVDRKTGGKKVVFPQSLLTQPQVKAMATQPDMILAFAKHLAQQERAQGRDVAVYARAFAVLNGRAPARLIDPTVDLTRESDSFGSKPWILPAPVVQPANEPVAP